MQLFPKILLLVVGELPPEMDILKHFWSLMFRYIPKCSSELPKRASSTPRETRLRWML